MRTAAVLPVKRFALAKRRLGASVAEPLRGELAEAMVSDVLHALAAAGAIELTIVVSGERSLAGDAHAQGALVLDDVADAGQSAAVTIGVSHALSRGIERVLCIPGDCPTLDPSELDRLLESGAAQAGSGPPGAHASGKLVVIVPDRHGSGTNGLLLAPPDVIEPSFGPGSCERHRALAIAAGAAWRLEHPPSLLLDIDTGEDLATLLSQPGTGPQSGTRARRTRALLERVEHEQLLSAPASG